MERYVLKTKILPKEEIEQQMVVAAMRAMLKTEDFSLAEQVFAKVKQNSILKFSKIKKTKSKFSWSSLWKRQKKEA